LYRFGPSLSDGRRLRHTNSLDHAIETKWGRGPFILKGAIAAVEKAMELEGRALPSDFALSPRVWTSSKEVEVAERFFAARGLEPARTIGIHLTAATYDVDLRIWRWESFFELAAHFLANGYQVLLITGALSLPIPTPLESESWRFHQDFLDRFRFSDLPHREEAALFYGDALAEAEVIRRCAVFLSAETGPAHLASAIGTPKVTIASSDLHQAAWMLTGPNDFGFVTEKDQQRRIVGPTEEEVIGAVETLLQRRAANALACG
jgi:hypothetical protein